MCKCAEGVVVVHGVEPERAQQEQHKLVLGHGVVSVVPHESDSPEQGKREKGARGGGVLTQWQEKVARRRWTTRKQPVMG